MKINLKEKIVSKWNEIPNSVKFWNILLFLILIVVAIINIDLLWYILTIGSLLTIGLMIDDNFYIDDHLWIFLMPITWFFIAIGIIMLLTYIIFINTIVPFNKWLNRNKDKY